MVVRVSKLRTTFVISLHDVEYLGSQLNPTGVIVKTTTQHVDIDGIFDRQIASCIILHVRTLTHVHILAQKAQPSYYLVPAVKSEDRINPVARKPVGLTFDDIESFFSYVGGFK